MIDLLLPFIIFTLLAVIIGQWVQQHLTGKQMQEERARLLAAIMSKNSAEYQEVLKTENQPKEEKKQGNADEVSLDQASDQEFDKFIKQQTE
jgi:hypothetical protein